MLKDVEMIVQKVEKQVQKVEKQVYMQQHGG